MFQSQVRFLLASFMVFFGIIFLEISITSIITLSLPNQFKFTVIENFKFYSDLFAINPAAVGRLILIENPLLLVQRLDGQSSSQIWGLYLMPISILTQYMLSVFIVFIKKQNVTPYTWLWICLATVVLLFVVFYFRIQTCCTFRPTWLLNVWLLSIVYNPLLDTVFWQDVYIQLSEWLPIIQLVMAATSLLVLFLCYRFNTQRSRNG